MKCIACGYDDISNDAYLSQQYVSAVICCAKLAHRYAELERNNGRIVVPSHIEQYIIDEMLSPTVTGPVGQTGGSVPDGNIHAGLTKETTRRIFGQ